MFDDIDTPAVLIDLDVVERNVRRYQDYCDRHGLALRPHIKTHKIPELARLQADAGARGITCQKIGEAMVFAEAGFEDIMLTYNVLGAIKLARMRALAERTDLKLVADNELVVGQLSEGFAAEPRPLAVLVECDTGGGRCGVQSPEAALALARRIDRSPGLAFRGLMTYPAKGAVEPVQAWLAEARELCETAGLDCGIVSNGGTPGMWRAHEVSVATEHRAGTYIYNDRSVVAAGVCDWSDCALTVLATVVSRPTETRAVLDAGSKSLTTDLFGLQGHGAVPDYPEASVGPLSEEHAVVDLSRCNARPGVGDRLRVVPNHACVVSNMVDQVYAVRGEQLERVLPVAARGLVQ